MADVFENDSIEEKDNALKRFISFKNILFALLILIVINLLYLDILIIKSGNIKTIEKIISTPSSTNNQNDSFCSLSCITKINEEIQKLNKQTVSKAVTPTPTIAQTPSVGSSSVKEYYIPFGSGSGNSSDWQDVAGLQAYVDSAGYPNIKSVVFEASLHIPTGNETATVRLYNATDGHPVWNSEVNFNGNASSVFLTSSSVSLDNGNKLYKVQMKTQLQFNAVLDQSRLHITTK